MHYDKDPAVEWSLGTVIMRNGNIFCSPNSKRAVSILDEAESSTNPFQTQESINYNFFQPAWWNWSCGWMAFVPLSPSFLSLPFQSLSWKPRIYRDDRIVSSPPPEPCNINGALRLEATIASDGLNASNNWLEVPMPSECFITFQERCRLCPLLLDSTAYIERGMLPSDPLAFVADGLWCGWAFLSYLIAQTSRPEYQKPSQGLLPGWYKRFWRRTFHHLGSMVWRGSSVCAFDPHTVRAGVILSFTDNDRHRPPAQWFLKHRVPCWYQLTRFTEEYMKRDSFLRKLIPPAELLQAELTKLFAEPRLPLALFVFKKYSGFEWKQCNEEIKKIFNLECTTSTILDMCSE